jgi:hypothetical protein
MKEDKAHPTVSEHSTFSDHVAVEKKNVDDRVVGFSESERQGVTTSSDQQQDGRVSLLLSGLSPQGEDDSLQVCRILIQAMNRAGASWSQPVMSMERDADCEATDSLTAVRLEIQVVRAIEDPTLWKALNEHGAIQRTIEPADFVPLVRNAITKKLKYPVAQRARLILALDANRLPAVTTYDVLTQIRIELKDWLPSIGFREIWLVGPLDDLTFRLYP